MSAVFAFCGVGVATALLVVGEFCFRSAKWIADRCRLTDSGDSDERARDS